MCLREKMCFNKTCSGVSYASLRYEFSVSESARFIKHGNPLQYSCLENPKDRGAWWASVHGAAESDTAEAT